MEGVKLPVFAFKDKKTQSFAKPIITEQSKEVYVKGTLRAAVRAEGVDKAYAKDQALYYLGTYDDGTAKFDLLEDPEKIFDLEDYIIDGKRKE